MSTDKLADALDNAEVPIWDRGNKHMGRKPGWVDVPVLVSDDPYCHASGENLAAWLRTAEGIAALAEDETIREGVLRLWNEQMKPVAKMMAEMHAQYPCCRGGMGVHEVGCPFDD